jgi:hypothetical protein
MTWDTSSVSQILHMCVLCASFNDVSASILAFFSSFAVVKSLLLLFSSSITLSNNLFSSIFVDNPTLFSKLFNASTRSFCVTSSLTVPKGFSDFPIFAEGTRPKTGLGILDEVPLVGSCTLLFAPLLLPLPLPRLVLATSLAAFVSQIG